ncbi:hypothetical protein V497_05173 [Pseudogymnoascus sp. VKM F-4516 (FW-969)]|nr:hypothetical protein V497_05173 [Pseudogymnoascus sp. VKM F-4516 (FW-969)]
MSSPAPWASLFHTHLTHLSPPTFTLSTLHHTPSLTPPWSPRARTCVFRGMFGSGPGATPSSAAASELLTFTTDVRSGKVPDLVGSEPTGGRRASGGGGKIEAVFWVEGVRTQWRVRGDAWVVGPDIGGKGEGAERVKAALKGRMRVGEGWGWEAERDAFFGAMGRELKKGLAGPPPGEVSKGADGGNEFDEEEARRNFRLVVVRPAEVECVDLTDPESSKRWIYTFVEREGGGGDWKRQDLNPGLGRTERLGNL